jgi:tetratricopeptide (TPR) repeat protein
MDQARQEYELAHFAESEKLLLSALRLLSPTDDANRARTFTMLGHAYVNMDSLNDAERTYMEAVAIYRRLPGRFDTNGAVLVLRNLGSVYSMQRRHDDAIRVLQEAMKVIKSHDGAVDVQLLADVTNILGIVHYRQNRMKKAEELFKQALDMVSTLNVPFNRTHLLNNLGTVYHAKRDPGATQGRVWVQDSPHLPCIEFELLKGWQNNRCRRGAGRSCGNRASGSAPPSGLG